MKNKLYISLPIEHNPAVLQEYGRAVVLTNNLEYFLAETIKQKGISITNPRATLGQLIVLIDPTNKKQNNPMPKSLFVLLKKLNDKRIKLIHGTVITAKSLRSTKECDFIQNNNIDTPITIEYIKKYSKAARSVLQNLITLR